MSFVEQYGLWSDDQQIAAQDMIRALESGSLQTVRFSFPDQHGVLRGKTLVAEEAIHALRRGVNVTTTLLCKDTSHQTVFPVFSTGGGFNLPDMQGAADIVLIADPSTFKVLPWTPTTGWVLCDAYFGHGGPVPFATRSILKQHTQRLQARNMELLTGLEVECHLFKLSAAHLQPEHAGQFGKPGTPPDVELLNHGYQFLTEQRYDAVDDVMQLIRETCQGLGLPLRSLEIEIGPSQFEFTFGPQSALQTADDMIVFRSAVKQVCQRHGYHATFMCRPRIPNVISSGWHLHQSLRRLSDGRNLFMPEHVEQGSLSPLGKHYLAGLLKHAGGSTTFSTPTLNGYRRYRSYSMAPDRAIWGKDNRGVMLRVLGGVGDGASRIENRVGEPAANPYLYLAAQIIAGLDGIDTQLDPGPSADLPYETDAARLPISLEQAMAELKADPVLVDGFGKGFVDYFCHIKQAEIDRFNQEVSEWEHREYFDLF